ncbi:transcriptional regulatory [Fusarium phyllophilum]|uniref:Transcriptional regulatory n=1 Tax=Fusarium phyllophilum TaxID=47803 RepID=A0A8H5NH11_9HYPO|nr:transcriptional regulatory [Fusarium phyllophilum]
MDGRKLVLVTGANTGLGFQIARAVCSSDKGYEVLLGGRSLQKAEQAVKNLKEEFPTSYLRAIQLDIEDDISIASAFEYIKAKYGKLDALINNAGVQLDQQLTAGKMSAREMWNKTYDVNVTGTHILTYTSAPLLLKSSDPRLMFIASGTSSLAGSENPDLPINKQPNKGWPKALNNFNLPAYRSSKTAMNMMMREWYRLLGQDGVKVWAISPGYLATGLGVGQEQNKTQGAIDPSTGAAIVRDVLEGAAGLQYIFATASAKNHEILQELGATHCFDYRSRSVVEDVQQAQKTLGINLTLAFDTVGKGVMGPADADSPSTPELTKSALGASEGLRLACTLPVPIDRAFGMCTSYRPSGRMNAIGPPQDPDSAIRIRKIMEHLCVRRRDATSCSYEVSTDDRLRHTQAQARLEHLEHLVGLLAEQRSIKSIGFQNGTPATELPHDSDTGEHIIASSSSGSDQAASGATHWSAMLDDIQALRSTLDPSEGNDIDEGDTSAPQVDVGMGMEVLFGAGLSRAVSIEQILNTYLPSRRSTDRLVSTYFRVRLYITPYIHSVQFQRQYEAFWIDPGASSPLWISILFSVLFIAANISRTGKEHEIPGHGFAVAAAQCLALGEHFRPKAFCFEALLLYLHSRFIACLEISPDMGAILSVLAHIATVSGYHRESSVPSLSPFTAEMRRRAWSSFMQIDLLVSFHLGVPSRITLAVSDTQAPSNLLDSDFDELSAQLPSPRPDSELTGVSFSILKQKFMTIFDKILQHALVNPLNDTIDARIDSLDTELKDLYGSLPELYRPRPMENCIIDHPQLIIARLCISSVYYKSICVLHRPHVPKHRDKSIQECYSASSALVTDLLHVYEECQPGGQLDTEEWFTKSITWHDLLLGVTTLCLVAYATNQTTEGFHIDQLDMEQRLDPEF